MLRFAAAIMASGGVMIQILQDETSDSAEIENHEYWIKFFLSAKKEKERFSLINSNYHLPLCLVVSH